MKNLYVLSLIALILFPFHIQADTFYSRDHGDWNNVSTWYQGRNGHIAERLPGPDDHIVIVHKIYRTGDLDIGSDACVWVLGIGELMIEGDLLVDIGGRLDNFATVYAANVSVAGYVTNFGAVNTGELAVDGLVENLGRIECVQAHLLASGKVRGDAEGLVEQESITVEYHGVANGLRTQEKVREISAALVSEE